MAQNRPEPAHFIKNVLQISGVYRHPMEVGLGVLLALFAVLVDPLGLSSPGFSRGQLLLVTTGLFLVFAGILGRRITGFYKNLTVLLVNVVTILVLIEVGAGLLSKVISLDGEFEDDSTRFLQNLPPYYDDKPWTQAYVNEFLAAERYRYAPFVAWRRPPFQGEAINVDVAGHRVTPGAECVPGAYLVFAFGGSTMWGTSAPDWGTIPAYLQAKLAESHDGPVCVINFGQSAYVSTQSLIELMLQLKAGNQPDLVIFFDGTNESIAAWQTGRADAHQNLSVLENVFSDARAQPPFEDYIADTIQENSYTAQMLERWTNEFEDSQPRTTYRTLGIETDDLAAQVVQNYLENLALVAALAEIYDFEVVFFWEPAIITSEKPLTPDEQIIYDGVDAALADLLVATQARISAVVDDYPYLHDLTHIVDAQTEHLWTDPYHVTPVGNEIIADEMLRLVAGRDG